MVVKGVAAVLPVVFMAVLIVYTPVIAAQTAADEPADTVIESGTGEAYKVVCTHCGKSVVPGAHGQQGGAEICPHCGEEVCARGEDEGICFGADAGLYSKYVSRGITLTEDPVFQPDVWLSYKGLGFSVWGNMDLTDVNGNEGEFNELDFTLGYSGELDGLSYSAGGIYYVFPNTGVDDTAELYTSLGYDVLFQPTFTAFYDFLEADGFYLVLGIGHGFELPLPVDYLSASLELSAQAGWGSKGFNEFNAGVYKDAFTHYELTASLPVTIGEHMSVSPMVSYSSAIDKDIRAANARNDSVTWGATISASF